MKHLIIILALLTASLQTFAQSPRIKLNQITKDSVTGSVLISSPTDSGMVYSRDLFISYGADTVLILGGDTLAKTSGIISSVLSDGVTITGDGTLGSELTADTSVLATLRALSDSLALVISSVTADNVTITGDGTVGSPLKVDTATVIATKQDLNSYYLDSNPDGYTSNTGTVTSVAATAGTGISVSGSPITTSGTLTITNTAPDQTVSIAGGGINAVSGTYPSFTVTGTEVDGSVTNEIQDISTTGAAGNISISGGSTLNLNVDDADASATNEGSLTVGAGTASTSIISSNTSGSTDVTLTAGTNVTLSETGNNITISATGGGTTYNNISETADTVYISDYLDVDTATLYVDAVNNRVGIGTSSPRSILDVNPNPITANNSLTFDGTRLGLDYGDRNIAIGFGAGNANSGNLNLCIGTNAGSKMKSTAISNVFFGVGAGSNDSITGRDNLGLGYASLYALNSGNENTGFGTATLDELTTGTGNVAIGYLSGRGITTGTYNVYIGNNALPNSPSVTNEIVIGYNRTGRGSNTISLGNTSITDIAGQVSFSTYSDARDKKNITDLNDGLNLIEKLRPVKFVWNTRDGGKVDVNDIGFIAQEVDGVQYQGRDVDYLNIVKYNSTSDDWTITYDKFTPIIVKAIQEQQAIIESQSTEIEQLKTLITDLSNRLTILENN